MELVIRQMTKDGHAVRTASGTAGATLTTPAYGAGDRLVFTAAPKEFIRIQLADGVAESLVYLPDGTFSFPIPEGEALRGFAPGTFSGEQTVRAFRATPEETAAYRNLCLNVLDVRLPAEVVDPDAPEWSNPTDSPAMANGEVKAYPHAYANRVTRNEGCFYARNAIDGIAAAGGHGNYPYHSWGGAVHEDLTLTVYFGRTVTADKLVLCLRSDYNKDAAGREHDTYWHTAEIALSDGFRTEIKLKKTAENQVFDLGTHRTEWVKLSRLDPLQHAGSLNFAALNQIELWGRG